MITTYRHSFAILAKSKGVVPVIYKTVEGTFVVAMLHPDSNSYFLMTARGDVRYFKTLDSAYNQIKSFFPDSSVIIDDKHPAFFKE